MIMMYFISVSLPVDVADDRGLALCNQTTNGNCPEGHLPSIQPVAPVRGPAGPAGDGSDQDIHNVMGGNVAEEESGCS
jgi:hypothetical protein